MKRELRSRGYNYENQEARSWSHEPCSRKKLRIQSNVIFMTAPQPWNKQLLQAQTIQQAVTSTNVTEVTN